MRYFKNTFIMLIALAAIGGYSYLDFESTRLKEEAEEEATRLLPFAPIEVLRITLQKEDSHILLERWDNGWRIIEPIRAKASDEAVEKFLGYITDSRNDSDYVMDPDPSDERLKEFGLTTPTVSVTLQTGADLKSYTLLFGDRAPSMGVAFAQLKGKKPVYRVLAYARAEGNKDIYYFRDKSVLRTNPVEIDQFAIVRRGSSIRLAKPQSGAEKWEISKPIKTQADNSRVFEIIGSFYNAEVKEFIAEKKDNLAEYGLDDPAVELLFWRKGDPEPTVRLLVGDRSPEKRGYYITMSDREDVFLLEEDTIHGIPRKVKELRSKQLFFFEADSLTRMEIRSPDHSMSLVKDLNKEWRQGSLGGEIMPLLVMNEFFNELFAYNIEDFITDDAANDKKFGFDKPSAQLLVWQGDSPTPISLNLGKKSPRGYVYGKRGSDESVLVLSNKLQRLLKTHFME